MITLEIPEDRIAQVAWAFREKANEYHGAVARHAPDDRHAQAWRETAAWFDAQSDRLRDILPAGEIKPA